MDSDQGKLFIGGISWETTEEKLKEHFEVYGDVVQTVVMKDKTNGRPRGFGFVVFADPAILDRVLQDTHTIEGRTVEAKRALSREEQQTSSRTGSNNGGRSFGSGGNYRTKKIFVGGLPPSLSEEGFRQYFEVYGSVTDVVIMYDQQTQRPRGFGFVSFDSEDAVDTILQKNYHDLNGKMVEVKRALPKDANPGGGRSMGGGLGSAATGGGGGGYQGYGASGGNPGSYEGRIDSNRYIQSQNNGGPFPPYGSTGYNAPSYGYGVANNYGAYGSYGGASSGYVNPNGQRGSWNTQASSGYGPVGYGNPGNGGPVSAAMGQSPGGTASYGNQNFGYGGYGGNEVPYANQAAAYGASGGRPGSLPNSNSSTLEMHGNFGGYMDGSSGYGNQGWRSDPSGNYGSQANGPASGQVGYGGGYGGPAARQVQQQ